MTAKQPIEDLLIDLQNLYDNPANPAHKHYYSKLALLELCGWLEAVLDNIALTYANSKVSEQKNLDMISKEIVGKTYGCDYNGHFRVMLIKIIGITKVEHLENTLISMGVFQILVSQLSSLWALRKPVAHTTIAGVTPTYHSPQTMNNFLNSLRIRFLCLQTN